MGKDKRARRRGASIHFYSGTNGGGKSLAMVHDTIPSLERGRRVLSTVRILDGRTGRPHPLYEPLTEWAQLLDFRDGDVLLDEVQGVASSRGSGSLPPAIVNLFLQLRRRDVLLRMSAPSFARADLVLREVCQAVTYCRGFLAEPAEGERLWAANRMFYWRTYNALEFDEFSAGKRERLKPLTKEWHWRPRHGSDRWYDTYAPVDHIADATEGGSCLRCGGARRRPKCSCLDVPAGEDAAPGGARSLPVIAQTTPDASNGSQRRTDDSDPDGVLVDAASGPGSLWTAR